jgi:putative ABC transport system ATP-binding protein
MIAAKGLTKVYGRGRAAVRALTDADFALARGEFVAIQGPSGCGKSTLLHILGCLEKADSGTLFLDDLDVGRLGDRRLAH